ncbi:MAG TPA: hypothetical protein VHN77_03990 [Phycisphaerales bacterium]|nr:hypothetical protein [Phycisphaerales bacterium]
MLCAGSLAASLAAQPTTPAPPIAPTPVLAPTPAPTTPPPTPVYEDAPEEQETEVILKDRRRVSGKLVEVTSESVVLAISGIPTVFKLDNIEAIRALPSVEERYEGLRAAIANDDIEGLLRLAEWTRQRGRLALALKDVESVLAQEPNNRAANELRTIIVEQQKLNALKAAPKPRTAPQPKPDGAAPEAPDPKPTKPIRPAPDTFPLLTDDQINIVRVFETDLKDPPAMIVKRETVTRFLDKYEGTIVEGKGIVPVSPEAREQFYRLRPSQVLSWFFDLRAREFYPEVQVLENPRTMRLFRDNVHRTWLINSCATSKCHGGEEAGRFYLSNKNQASDRAAYTNWVIIDQFKTTDGLPLIDFKDPARSPILQMGLPRDKAIIKHPTVEGGGRRWIPIFDDTSDRRYRAAVDWILSLYPNRAGYPIEYTPPVPKGLKAGENAPPAPPR